MISDLKSHFSAGSRGFQSDSAACTIASPALQAPSRDSRTWLIAPFLILLILALCSCTTSRGGDITYSPEGFTAPDAPSLTTLDEDYRIGPLDKLSVTVFQVKELSGEYQVDLTGHIAMPLLGNVRAVDKTPAQFQELLTEKLSAKYLKHPDVSVGILEASGSMLTLEGSVKKPGIYPVYGKMTLLQVIAKGEGLIQTANPKRIAIFRQIDGERTAAAFDLTTIRKGEDTDPLVYRGDIIVVDGSKTKEAWRNVIQSVPVFGLFRPFGY